MTGAATLLASLLVPTAATADEHEIFISEIHYDNASTDVGEAIEVQAPAGTDLTGWTLVLYNGNDGLTYGSAAAVGGVVPEAGVLVVNYPVNGLQNGAPDGVALVDGAGQVVEFLSYEGEMTAAGGPAEGMASTDIGVVEAGSDPAGLSLQKVDGAWTGPVTATFGVRNGTVTDPDPDPGPAPELCDVAVTPIGVVQGEGDASPLDGSPALVRGTVVGDFQTGGFNGYFVQDGGDANPATSDGIFVFAPSGTDVAVGDLVGLSGTVDEFNGQTQLTDVQVEVCDTDVALPAPVELTMPVLDHERYESMYVTYPQDLAILEYFNYGRFGEMVLGVGDGTLRQHQPTAVHEPGSPEAVALAEHNATHRITLDDGLSPQNPPVLRHPNGEPFSLGNSFRGGDVVSNLTGVLDYRFDLWRVQPTEGADYTPQNPRPAVPEVGGTTTVASFNVLNYFTTLTSEDPQARGADTETEFARQQAKIVAAINEMDTDVVGLMEIENNGDVAVGNLVDALNADADDAGKWAFVSTGVIGTDAIAQAFIYQPARVTPVGEEALLDSSVDARYLDEYNRPALAQTFEDTVVGGQVTVVVNHLKSKGSGCDAVGDPEDPDGQGNCNGVRTQAAQALADWASADPTGTGAEHALVIGDLNSYDKEDPIEALTAAGYSDLLLEFVGEYAYSYVFDGMLGYLDYAMANAALDDRVTGAAAWAINADEPSVLDYDMSFKPDEQDALYAPGPYRSSDHDPVLVGLDLTQEPAPGVDVTRWNGDNRYETAAVIAEQFGEVDTVYVATGVTAADALVGASPAANGLVPGLIGMATAPDGSAAPVVLAKPDRLPAATRGLIEAVDPANIVILGGPGAVSAAVEQDLEQYGEVARVAGANRYETASLLSDLFGTSDVVFLASGGDRSFADALAGSAVAGGLGSPVLLTKTDRLPSTTRDALVELSPSRIVVLGGELAVSDAVLDEVRAATGVEDVDRVAGPDRYQTALAVSAEFVASSDVVFVATGRTYPDALTVAAYAGAVSAPVLLTRPDELPRGLLDELDRLQPGTVVVVGGDGAVSTEVEQALEDWAAQP
ncbi:ExeM/NucH family extracellular endonuclease [Ornithinimicrobium pekingense]|uniref:ExeM/NucH family extracellular endonuclease n=1 Tax=Ornithinimicrobium pekingense TaxID=384677 RepID=UPI00146E43BA|nr:ExeM/NucH family extracellular endonuclease [Ornithinimicrobium pekingense]